MKITNNYELRAKFDAGLQIAGEDIEGNLEWIGSDLEWRNAEQEENNIMERPQIYE